jgi:hypothetical protein
MSCSLIQLSFTIRLISTASLAIWKMKSLVIAMATGAWGTGVIFEIQSKPLPPFGGSPKPHFKRAMVLAIVRVNNQTEL